MIVKVKYWEIAFWNIDNIFFSYFYGIKYDT